jgi:protein ImuB
LLKLVRLLLQADPPKAPIQKIVMAADAAPPRTAQGGLFVPRGPDPEKLELTIARLAKLVGEANVGVAELLDTFRAENFRISHWAGGATSSSAKAMKNRARNKPRPAQKGSKDICRTTAGFRMIRPVVTATVEVDKEQPIRVCFGGKQGDVVAASGPWRSSGEWWQKDGWDQDEWDLAIDFGLCGLQRVSEKNASPWPQYGVYRIYYDAPRRSWFVRGFYD